MLSVALASLMNIYPVGGLICFLFSTKLISAIFQLLQHEITTLQNTVGNETTTILRMTKWIKRYIMTFDLINYVNDCFGAILLIFVCHQFIILICWVFFIASNLFTFDALIPSTILLGTILENFFYFFLVVVSVDTIRNQVPNLF